VKRLTKARALQGDKMLG